MNNLNPPFMKNFFKLRSSHYSSRKPYDLKHIRPNQVTFGSNSLESVGPQIWNGLPNKMKSAENLKNFKLLIRQLSGPECKCSACYSFTFTEQYIFFKHFNFIRFRLVNFVYIVYIVSYVNIELKK